LSPAAFHQWADFSWAVVFVGLLGRWTANLRPLTIPLLALPWAIFSSATEWFLLVSLFPFWQPLFTLQQPYWIGLLVHGSSAVMYPLFARLRWRRDAAPERDVRFTDAWTIGRGRNRTARSGRAVRQPRKRASVDGPRQGCGPDLYPAYDHASCAGHRACAPGRATRAIRICKSPPDITGPCNLGNPTR
jgi:hypothetical protein